MKKFIILVSVIFFFANTLNLFSENLSFKNKKWVEKRPSLKEVLTYYSQKGYIILGPVEIIYVDANKIVIYRQFSVNLKKISTIIINENLKPTKLKKYDYIYFLKKGKKIIIIKTKRTRAKND